MIVLSLIKVRIPNVAIKKEDRVFFFIVWIFRLWALGSTVLGFWCCRISWKKYVENVVGSPAQEKREREWVQIYFNEHPYNDLTSVYQNLLLKYPLLLNSIPVEDEDTFKV